MFGVIGDTTRGGDGRTCGTAVNGTGFSDEIVLAPRERHTFEHGFGEPEMLQILRAVNQGEKFEDGLSSPVLQLSMIRQQA